MLSYAPILLALGALSSLAAADTIYTYTKPDCAGPAFVFKDIDHNVCAVSRTANSTSIADAIARNITIVSSGKLEVQETGKKRFIGWDAGPDSNSDGPLQCGTIAKNKPVKERETCISGSPKNYHGFSWTEPDNQDDDGGDPCKEWKEPNAVFLAGKLYQILDILLEDAEALVECAWNDWEPPADFDKYVIKRE